MSAPKSGDYVGSTPGMLSPSLSLALLRMRGIYDLQDTLNGKPIVRIKRQALD
jgi:hypothetical protein